MRFCLRLFLLQRWNAGGEAERIDPDFNEMGGSATANRWTLVAGNLSLLGGATYFDEKLFGEVRVPLLADMKFINLLEVNGAIRY